MAKRHRLSVRSDSQVSNIHSRLSTAHDQHILANSKLLPPLELRRVNYSWDLVQAIQLRDVWGDVQPRTDSYSIAVPL